MIEATDLSKSYDGCPVLHPFRFSVARGEVLGILGPNGSGKSTLLGFLSGVERPDGGVALLNGRPVADYPRKELAQVMAVLGQETLPPVGFTVRDVVGMGRFPYQNWLGREASDSSALQANVMERLGLTLLANRTVDRLSGGERQRVALAKALAQDPQILLMDEPTTYLDIGYQLQMMDLVRSWNRTNGLTVVAVLHDLNLAAQYCDRLLVLKDGRLEACGTPETVLTAELVERVYGTRPVPVAHPVTGVPQMMLVPAGTGTGRSDGE